MKKKKGFTLSEVLITLGAIGVVAAISIPPLMNNIQDKQFKVAAKAAYSKASQAVQLMKQDNGGSLYSYVSSYWANNQTNGQAFKTNFVKYFKIAQDCGWSDCVNSVNQYKTLINVNSGYINYWAFGGEFITTDGMFWAIANYGPWSTFNGHMYINISVDVNGYQKGPNIFGRDFFVFQLLDDDTFLPMGGINTQFPATDYCKKSGISGSYQVYLAGLGCMEYVMEGKDY